MAISDYLMTTLALAAQARGLARGTEEARAQREAAAQRANLAYLNTLIQTAGQIPGAIKSAEEEEIAKRLQEARLNVGTEDIGQTGMEEPTSPAAAVIPPAEPTPTTPAATAVTRTLLGSGAAGAAPQDQMQREKLGLPPPSPTELQARQLMEGQTPPAGIDSGMAFPSRRSVPPAATIPFAAPASKTTTAPPPPAPEQSIKARGKERIPSEEALVPLPTFTGSQTQAAPPTESDKVVATTAASPAEEISPSAKQYTSVAGDISDEKKDPFKTAQEEYKKLIKSYKPPKYAKTSEELAREAVEKMKVEKPVGNPIYDLLTFGEFSKKIKAADSTAVKLIKRDIDAMRKADQEQSKKEFYQMAKLEAEQIALTQKDISDRRKAELRMNLRTTNFDPLKTATTLSVYKEADDAINDVAELGRELINKKLPFPGGAQKVIETSKALFESDKPVTEQMVADLNASLGLAGAKGQVQFQKGMAKSAVVEQVITAMDRAEMPDESKRFASSLLLLIQKLGKAAEGKSLTDNDLKFYLKNMVVQDAKDPSTLLKSINQLKKTNARSHNRMNDIYTQLYKEYDYPKFEPLTDTAFTEQEMADADKFSGFTGLQGQAVGVAGEAVRSGTRTPSIGGLFGQLTPEAFKKYLDSMGVDPATAAALIQQLNQMNTPTKTPKPPVDVFGD